MFGMAIPISSRRVLAAALMLGASSGCSMMSQKPDMPQAHMSSHGTIIKPNPTARVIIDGAIGDWGPSAHSVSRPRDAATAGGDAGTADITTVTERSDAHYVYMRLDLARTTGLYGLPGTVSIDIDADGNVTTGADGDGLAGTDFAIDLSPMVNGRVTEGAALRVMHGGSVVKTTDTYGVDFVMLPTYASLHPEFRIARGRLMDSAGAPIFAGGSYRAQIAVHDATGAVRYRLPVFSTTLPALDTVAKVPKTDPLARAANTQFRVLQWNVANEGLRDRPDHFRRIIAAIDPDVLILDEVGGVVGHDGVGKFLTSLDSGRKGRPAWHYTYGLGGGYQRTVIASRTSVSEYPEFKLIPFPDSVTQQLLAVMPQGARARQRANIDSGVATGGALVSLNGKRVAIFGVDLQSAGNSPTSWQEQRRRAETRIIRDRALAAIHAHGAVDAIIAAGDHNLVSTREPLETMSEIGAAFDGASLVVAEPLQLDSATAATWEGSGGPFPPGRLDWVSFTGASLQELGGFVFDVGDLGPRWQAFHHLEADDSKKSSDHRPVVVDMRWRPTMHP
jgi:hypothetical protein